MQKKAISFFLTITGVMVLMLRTAAGENVSDENGSSIITAAAERLLERDMAGARKLLEQADKNDESVRQSLAMLVDIGNTNDFVAEFLRSQAGQELTMTIDGVRETAEIRGVSDDHAISLMIVNDNVKIGRTINVSEISAIEKIPWLGQMPQGSQALYRGLIASFRGRMEMANHFFAEAPPLGTAAIQINEEKVAARRAEAEAEAKRIREEREKRRALKAQGVPSRMHSFTPENGGGHQVHIYYPVNYFDWDEETNVRRPAAFLFSPGGNSRSILNRLKAAADELGWVLVGIDAYRNGYDASMRYTRAAFDEVPSHVTFDKRKIIFGGFSGGGAFSFRCSHELTRNAVGILSFGGWMMKKYDKQYPPGLAVAIVNGSGDNAAISWEERDIDFLRSRARANVRVFRFNGAHVMAPSETAAAAARWIHQQKRLAF